MGKRILLLVAACFHLVAHAQSGTEPVKLTDLLKIRTVGNVTLTQDGSMAAFTLTSIEPQEGSTSDYRYATQIYSVPAGGNALPKQLTYARERASQPAWSPDGRQLAFVRAVNGRPQVFILPMQGGEPWQLTDLAYGASAPVWSPDGKSILFTATVSYRDLLKDSLLNPGRLLPAWPQEKPGIDGGGQTVSKAKPDPDGSIDEIRSYLEKNETDNKARVFSRLNFQSESDLSTEPDFTHLYLVAVQAGTRPRPLTRGFYRFGNAAFLPNGRSVIFSGSMDSLQHPDRALESSLFLVDTDGTGLRTLLAQKGVTFTSPRVSPSGRWLAFLQGPASFVSVPRIAIAELGGDLRNAVTIGFDRAAGGFTWTADERQLYFTAQSNGGAPLYRLNLSTRNVEQLTDFNSGVTSFDLAGNVLAFSRTEVADPSGLYTSDPAARNIRKAGDFNDWVKTRRLSFPEKHSFTNEKGLQVEYWVMKPAQAARGKAPLLLEIHGGPSAMWGPGEASMWHEFQYFCGRGYGVVYGNPRGSGGYGQGFLQANVKDWGTGPASDVLTSLERTIAEGWADTSKLLITGGSYAGYLVAWIIAHDHRFKAACSQRGVYDLATFFGEGNAWRLVPNYFGGYPWEPEVRMVLNRESPINYVSQITTPYIIFHGDNDRRTGFVQSEMLYRSLKVLGRPVEYVRHPGATHEITRSGDNRQRMDQLLRTYEFFERWLKTNADR